MASVQYSKEKALETMLDNLQSTLHNPVYGDLTIVCGDKKWRMSKLILSTQSAWFKTLCESKFKEAAEATVDLSADDPEAISAMLSWCYKFDYDDSDSDGENLIISRELLNVRIFALAEKYFIKPLQILAAEKFAAAAKKNWGSPDFAIAVKEAFQNVHDPEKKLRSAITAIAVEHAADLVHKEQEYPEFHSIMTEVPEVAMEMVKELVPNKLKLPKRTTECRCKAKKCKRDFHYTTEQVRDDGLGGLFCVCPFCHRNTYLEYNAYN